MVKKPRKGSLRARLKKIALVAMDVDGTLTDGSILLSSTGDEIKAFNSRDGIGLKLLSLAAIPAAFVTARGAPAVERRARELGVRDVILNSSDKGIALRELSEKRGVPLEQIAFIGDDLQDLAALLICGVSVTVHDAPKEVHERVDIVTQARGGHGAVREAIELLLRAQGRFAAALGHFLR